MKTSTFNTSDLKANDIAIQINLDFKCANFQAHMLIFYIYLRHGLVKFDFRRAHSTLAGQRENGYVLLTVRTIQSK